MYLILTIFYLIISKSLLSGTLKVYKAKTSFQIFATWNLRTRFWKDLICDVGRYCIVIGKTLTLRSLQIFNMDMFKLEFATSTFVLFNHNIIQSKILWLCIDTGPSIAFCGICWRIGRKGGRKIIYNRIVSIRKITIHKGLKKGRCVIETKASNRFKSKVEKTLKGILVSIPSPSVKIQIMDGKVCLKCKGKTLLGVFNKLLKTKSLLTSPSNVLPYYLK